MDWSRGYALIVAAAFLSEYIRVRVDYHILELTLICIAVPVLFFAVCVVCYLVLASLTDRVCNFIEGNGFRTDL